MRCHFNTCVCLRFALLQYCDVVPETLISSFRVAIEVFQLADRFDLDALTDLLVPAIAANLSIQNVIPALQFAYAHRHSAGGERLKRVAQEFAKIHWYCCFM